MNSVNKIDIGLLILRIAFGIRLIYGTIDNIISWPRMLEFKRFLLQNGFPFPLTSAIVSVYLQFICGILWIVGYKVKYVSIVMILNFIVAIVGIHILHNDTYIRTSPAVHLLVISIFFFLVGPGRISLDKDPKLKFE